MGKREDGGWCIWGVCESEAVQHGCGLRMLCEKIGCGCGCGCGRGEGGGLESGVLGLEGGGCGAWFLSGGGGRDMMLGGGEGGRER